MTEALIALLSLTVMEIVLGIDNLVFISILTGKLPESQRLLGWRVGLGFALLTRIALLGTLFFFVSDSGQESAADSGLFRLTAIGVPEMWIYGSEGRPSSELHENENEQAETTGADGVPQATSHNSPKVDGPEDADWISVRDLILLAGGLFLIGKSTFEIHERIEVGEEEQRVKGAVGSFASVIVQIALLDIVFSIDSVITAVGMAKEIWVMIVAVVISVIIMMMFAQRISDFVHNNPTIKMLALSFLILIGVLLVTEAIGTPLHRGYVYFAMGFSLVVELLNMFARRGGASQKADENIQPSID